MLGANAIAVDLTPMAPGGINGGTKVMTLGLLREFRRLAPERRLILLVNRTTAHEVSDLVDLGAESYEVLREHFPVLQDKSPLRTTPRTASLAGILGADVLFCPFLDPWFAEPDVPTVCVVHDVQHRDLPANFSPAEQARRDELLGRVVRVADHVITTSTYSRQRLELHLGLSPLQITVLPVPMPRRGNALPEPQVSTILARLGLDPGQYFLYPANFWPHKNHERLLRAYASHRQRWGDLAADMVFTGMGQGEAAARASVRRLRLDGNVRFLGYVPDSVLEALWRGCRCFITASLYEGFGIPLCEAMSFGKPILSSDATSLPEVAGDAALLFDAEDESAIARALDETLRDPTLLTRLADSSSSRLADFALVDIIPRYLSTLDEAVAASRNASPKEIADRAEVSVPSLSGTSESFISVVMPSYQDAPYLERSILSVLTQDFTDYDFTVCDGGSTDGTVDILRRYEDRVRWVSEPDEGQADAVNKAISMSCGEIIAWLNSDDIYYPGTLRLVARLFRENPSIDGIYGVAYHIGPANQFIDVYDHRPWNPDALREWCFLSQPATFFRRSLIDQYGPLDARLRYCLDYELWLRFSDHAEFLYIPIRLAGSRLYAETKTIAERAGVIREINDMLRSRYGAVPDRWILGFCHNWLDEHRAYNRADPLENRRYVDELLWVASYACARWETPMSPHLRRTLISEWRSAHEVERRLAEINDSAFSSCRLISSLGQTGEGPDQAAVAEFQRLNESYLELHDLLAQHLAEEAIAVRELMTHSSVRYAR